MQSLGQRLKAAREAQKLTLEKVFQATRIRVPYLQALEDDDLSVMPSPVQARGYLRNYAEYLGLNLDRLLEEARASQKDAGDIIRPADLTPAPAAQTPEPLPPQGTRVRLAWRTGDSVTREAEWASDIQKAARASLGVRRAKQIKQRKQAAEA